MVVRRVVALGLAVGCLLFAGCDRSSEVEDERQFGEYAGTPQEAYVALFEPDEVDDRVEQLQGGGTAWQGYKLYLRFRAPQSVVDGLVDDYEVDANCRRFRGRLTGSRDPSEFVSNWEPGELSESGTCWLQREVKNGWTEHGNHHLHWNPDTRWVHFVGLGA